MCWDRSGAIYRYEYAFLHQWSWKLNCMSHFTRAICWSFDIYSAWLWVFPLMGRLCCDFTQGFYAWELMPRWVKPLWACWIAMSLHGWSSFFFFFFSPNAEINHPHPRSIQAHICLHVPSPPTAACRGRTLAAAENSVWPSPSPLAKFPASRRQLLNSIILREKALLGRSPSFLTI